MISVLAVVFCLLSSYGCVTLVAGAAGGAGTAVWLSGKLVQQADVSYEKAVRAAKSGLESLKLEVTKETRTEEVTQIMSKYTDGKTIWIDVRPVSASTSKVEVRVGLVSDEAAAQTVMDAINKYF
jgi:hypothetical protein